MIPLTLTYVGDATSGADGNAVYQATGLNIVLENVSTSARDIFGVLIVRNAYVPVSAERFDVRLGILQD